MYEVSGNPSGLPPLRGVILSLGLTSGISRGAQVSTAPSAACHVRPHVYQLARRFAKSALTAGTSLTGIFIMVVVVDRYAASSSATPSMSDCAS
jgi:hypothetical protein